MTAVKTRTQGNATVITIPRSFKIEPGRYFEFSRTENGGLMMTPVEKVPDTIEELFKDWNGPYPEAEDLKEWENMKPEGEELC